MANKKLNGKAFALNSIDPVKLDARSAQGDFLAFNASGVLAPHSGMNVSGASVQFNQDLVISGNLTIQGSAVTVDSTDTSIKDAMVELNSNASGSATADAGVEVARAGGTTSKLYFSESSEDAFALIKGEDATEYIIASEEDMSAADAALNSSLTGETARAMAAEGVLTQNVSNEEAARLANDTVLSAMLATQLSDFTSDLATHNGNIDDAISASQAAEVALSGSVDSEIAREQAKISELTGLLNTEDGRQNNAMSGLEGDLAAEITREQTAMSGLESDLANEISREGTAISNLTTKLNTENTDATTKEGEIQAEIDDFNAAIAAETVRASGATIALQAKYDAAFAKMGIGTTTFDPTYWNNLNASLAANGTVGAAEFATNLASAATAAGLFQSTSEAATMNSIATYVHYMDHIVNTAMKNSGSDAVEQRASHTCMVEYTYAGATVSAGELVLSSPADVNVENYSGYGDVVVSCNGLRLPDAAVTFTITPGVKSSDHHKEFMWVTRPVITEVKIDVDAIHYEIEAGDFFIIEYDKHHAHPDKAGYEWNEHDETPYCGDPTATNYVEGANVIDNNLCTYPLSCSDTQITIEVYDSWGDGGAEIKLYESDGTTEKLFINSGSSTLTLGTAGATGLSVEDIWCTTGVGANYVLGLISTDNYATWAESGVRFYNDTGEILAQNGTDLSIANGTGAAGTQVFPSTMGQEVKYTITLESDGSITVTPV